MVRSQIQVTLILTLSVAWTTLTSLRGTHVSIHYHHTSLQWLTPLTADVITLNKWPVRSDAAREALTEMDGKFYVIPIPAYDMHGELIDPDCYRRRLEGALVAVRFTLTHRSVNSRDIYTADVENIRVLSPPKPTLVTPRNRGRVPAFDPMSPLPLVKKRRLFE